MLRPNTRTSAEIVSQLSTRQIGRSARADPSLIDEKTRTVPFIIISDENSCERYDWWENEVYIEEIDIGGADATELKTFFKDHRPSVDNAIGRVENIRTEDGQMKVDVVFGRDDDSFKIFRKYLDGILTDVSIGYTIQEVITTEKKDEPTHVLVTACSIHELSAVWKGADKNAVVGRSSPKPKKKKKKKDKRSVAMLQRKLRLKEKL